MYKISKLAAGSVIAATAALGSAGMALADGYEPKGRVAYERPSDWSGVYFGLHSGYQWSSIDVAIEPGSLFPFSVDHSSEFVGGHIGIQHQWGNIVLGVEGNLDMMFRNSTSTTICPDGSGATCAARLDDILSVGGRAGWAAGHWMPYVTGGYANARFTHEVFTGAAPVLNNTASTRNNGWYVGGGVEWIVSPGWTAGVEYRHYEFDTNTDIAFTPAGTTVNLRSIDASTESVMARVSWKFGREYAAPLK